MDELLKDENTVKYRVLDRKGKTLLENVTYLGAVNYIEKLPKHAKEGIDIVPVVADGRQVLFENM